MKKILILLLIFFSRHIQAFDKDIISPPEGKYNYNITLNHKNTGSSIYFYFDNSKNKAPLIFNQSDNPLILSAAEGEEKKYKIIFTDKNNDKNPAEMVYIIDRKKPFPPEAVIDSNFLTFKKNAAKIFFRINRSNWTEWNNEKLKLSSFNTVFYYSMDSAGNKSIVKTWSNQHYSKYRSSDNKLKIYSPEKGNYYNKQLLYIDSSDFDWIRYSFRDRESSLKGNEYKKPVIIDKTGSITLFIAGKLSDSDNIVFSSVSYNVNEDTYPLKSDLFTDGENKYFTSVSSRIVLYSLNNNIFNRYEKPVKLVSDTGSLNFNTLNLKAYNDNSGYSYRYFYFFDNRKKTSSDRLDKKTEQNPAPPVPVLSGIKSFPGGGKQIYLKQKKNISFVYTIRENTPPENPSLNDTASETLPLIINPYGRESDYFVKISSIDKYGNISEPLTVSNINVDHYPPEKPEISLENDMLDFISENDVFYRVISAGSRNNKFKKHTNPVFLQSVKGTSENISIEYYSSDSSGNKSRNEIYRYKTDNTYPFLKNNYGIKTENHLNSDYILKKSYFSNDYDIYYTFSESISPPPDPDLSSAKLEKDILFKCPSGSEKHFTLKILPVSQINNNTGDITEIYIHIDKISPPLPVLSNINKIYYSDNAVINIKGALRGNTVYYSYSSDENSISSPFEGSAASDSTIVISNPVKSRKTFYLKTAVSDKSGNKTFSDHTVSLIIDNRDYPEKLLDNLKETTITDSTVSVKKPDNNYIYRYQISNRKDALRHVDYKSAILDSNLVFDSLPGEEKIFYLSVKAYFDTDDRKGSEEKIYYIKTDRKKPSKPLITISESNTIQISGENKIIYAVYPEKTAASRPEYKIYKKPFMLNKYIPAGRYNIKAYSQDKAGNISEASDDSFYISKKSLYISADKGNDSNSGTLSSPLKTINKALEYYRKDKIDTIFLLPGNYSLSGLLTVDYPLLIKGFKNKTYIRISAEKSSGLFKIRNTFLILKDLSIKTDEYSSSFISSEKSLLVLDNSEIQVNSSRFLKMDDSRLIIENSDIQLESVFSSEPFNISSGRIYLSGSSFNISSSSGIKAFTLKDSSSSLKNCSFSLNSDESLFSESLNSILRYNNIRLKIESGRYSSFFDSIKSRISISDSFFTDSPDSEKSFFINSSDTNVNISGSSINLSSLKESSFINAEKGDFNINRLLLIISAGDNNLPAVKSDNAVIHIEDSDITLKSSVTGGFINSDSSIIELYSSEINDISGKRKYLMDFKGRGTAVLKNNIFSPEELLIRREAGVSVIRD